MFKVITGRRAAVLLGSLLVLAFTVTAAAPVVKTVPWVPSNPLIPHDTYAGKNVTLKGTTDVQGAGFTWTWDFGDGSPVATGTVSDRYVVQAQHVYAGPVGTVWTATLTVRNTATGETGSKNYYVKMEPKTLPAEVNVAIDEGLWYIHKNMIRSGDVGDWLNCGPYGCNASLGYYAIVPANVQAFLVNGHSEGGSADNPYTETVQRGMKRVFQLLYATGIPTLQTNPFGSFNPDFNGNGLGISVNQGNPFYQGGMFMDAIIATGTPDSVTTTGPTNVIGRTYRAIVQDMADFYFYCQYDSSYAAGGWRYSCNEYPDNSAAQWGAIGLIPAERNWGYPPGNAADIPKAANRGWTYYSQYGPTGRFGYTDPNYEPWGPWGTTPSGMVQLAWTGIGRGVTGPGLASWDKAETAVRDNFPTASGAYSSVRDYYYGLFGFVKAMLLHPGGPIHMLQSSTPGVAPIDWYAAEVSKGDPTDGVARTLVNDQNADGCWYGHNVDGNQMRFETAWAIIMLNKTLFESGAPVAVATAVPNPAVAGQVIALTGENSFHQDPNRTIVKWEWDLDNNGTFEFVGLTTTVSFPVVGTYPVKLRVTDDAGTPATATTTLNILVTTPPVAPTADAGGPYSFCPQFVWYLNGTGSINPDQGQSEPGKPGDTIQSYLWDLDGDGQFDDATGATPDVTAFFTAKGPGSYLIQLKVTDTTGTSFPSSGMGDLSDTDSAVVVVKGPTDPACACVSNLSGRGKPGKVDLVWTPQAGVHHYNIYRGTVSGGPYLKVGQTAGNTGVYADFWTGYTATSTFYFVVRAALINNSEICQSNQAAVTIPKR